MNLGDFSRVLQEEFGARELAPGEASSEVSTLSVEEPLEGWLCAGSAALTSRPELTLDFLRLAHKGEAAAVVWRSSEEVESEVVEESRRLGLGLLVAPPEIPLGRYLSALSDSGEGALLRLSHAAGRTLSGGVGEGSSLDSVAAQISRMLGRAVVVEDAVGRLIPASPDGERGSLLPALEEEGLRASRPSGVDETRRERRDRYARLPDGFLSVPVERWRTAGGEFFWTPVGEQVTSGYLWFDLEGRPLAPEDVVHLYWARRVLKTELDKDRIRLETELGVRGDFVDDLISGHYGSVELLLQRALYLGADLSGGALVLIVDIDDFARYLERRRLKEPAIQELKRRLADAVRLQTRQVFSNFLTGPRSDNVILFIGLSERDLREDFPEKTQRLTAQIQRYIKGLLTDLTVSVGIGRYKESPADLPEAYAEAEVALEIGHRIHGPSSVSTFEGTGTYKLLYKVLRDDPQELASFYEETLAPLVAYDDRYGTELVGTLITYLSNDASTVKTAQGMFAHRHTIRYRLDRASELTGLDIEKSEDRERLTLGIKAMQLLGRAPERPPGLMDR